MLVTVPDNLNITGETTDLDSHRSRTEVSKE